MTGGTIIFAAAVLLGVGFLLQALSDHARAWNLFGNSRIQRFVLSLLGGLVIATVAAGLGLIFT